MTGKCCTGGRASRRPAGRLSRAATSILPGAVLVLLPKCPLCLAAWLTVVTGVGFSAAGAAWVRGILVVFWVAAGAFAAAPIIRRRLVRRKPALFVVCTEIPAVGMEERQAAHAGLRTGHPTAVSTEVSRPISSGSSVYTGQ